MRKPVIFSNILAEFKVLEDQKNLQEKEFNISKQTLLKNYKKEIHDLKKQQSLKNGKKDQEIDALLAFKNKKLAEEKDKKKEEKNRKKKHRKAANKTQLNN